MIHVSGGLDGRAGCLTVQLDEDLIRRAKVIAAERGTSVSGLVTQQITKLIEARDRYTEAQESALEMMSAATDRPRRPPMDPGRAV